MTFYVSLLCIHILMLRRKKGMQSGGSSAPDTSLHHCCWINTRIKNQSDWRASSGVVWSHPVITLRLICVLIAPDCLLFPVSLAEICSIFIFPDDQFVWRHFSGLAAVELQLLPWITKTPSRVTWLDRLHGCYAFRGQKHISTDSGGIYTKTHFTVNKSRSMNIFTPYFAADCGYLFSTHI